MWAKIFLKKDLSFNVVIFISRIQVFADTIMFSNYLHICTSIAENQF